VHCVTSPSSTMWSQEHNGDTKFTTANTNRWSVKIIEEAVSKEALRK